MPIRSVLAALAMIHLSCALAHAVPPLEVWSDIRLDPGKTYGPIMIRASGITVDGRGARVVGSGEGVGVLLDGVSDVTVRALRVSGFDAGLVLRNGAHRNRVADNELTGCGDGIVVRGDNGWPCSGNVFEANASRGAARRGVLITAPGNVFTGNTARGCGTGFLVAGTDRVELVGNDASGNREDGIAVRHGPARHLTMRGNTCADNGGAGIAIAGRRAEHLVVEENTLARNAQGLAVRGAHWIDLGSNRFDGNAQDVFQGGDVTELLVRPDAPPGVRAPVARLEGGTGPALVARPVAFDASRSLDPSGRPLTYRWDMGDGTVLAGPRARHAYAKAGTYRVGLTVTNGFLCALASRDVHVIDRDLELGTGGGAAPWEALDPDGGTRVTFAVDAAVKLVGASSIRARLEPYGGGPVSLRYPRAGLMGIPFSRWMRIELWLRIENANAAHLQGENPVLTLHETPTRAVTLTPRQDVLGALREGWLHLTAPAHGDELWQRAGDDLTTVNWLTIGVDSHGREPLTLWVDGLGFGGR